MATDAAGAAGLLTGLFSKKTRRGVFIIFSMPTSMYGFFLFILSKFGIADRFTVNIYLELFSVFPTVSAIRTSGRIDIHFKEIFASQVVVDGFVTIISFAVIPIAVLLCGDRFLMKRSAAKKTSIIVMATMAVLLLIDFYIDGVDGDIFEQLLYANSDFCIINMGIYHAGPIILYYGAVSAIVTMLNKPASAYGESEGS
jgi:hypothetical protein